MNQLNKDQKLALLGASLYYMGLGGFLYNSQSTVLAAVRAQYDFPMTRISLYTTMGYVAAVLGTVLFGSMIFRLSQSRKKWYFIGMLSSGALGVFLLACFADTPLFYASFALLSFATSTISIITAYVINQWIRENAGTVIGISAASAGVGGMIGNPVASALLERFSLQNGVLILLAIAVLISGTGIVLMFRKPIPEGDPIPAGQEVKTGGTKPSAKRLLVMSVLLGIVVAGPRTVLLFVSYLSMFAQSNGFSPAFGAALSSVLMFGNITSKLVYGYLSDHIGTWKATFLFQGLVMVGVLLFILFPGSAVSLGIGTLCYGMMYALVNIGVNRMALAAYGYEGLKKYQGPLMSIGSIVVAVASPVVGIMFDRTGSFRPYFLMLVGIMSLCMVLTGVVARMRAKDGVLS